MTDHKFTDDEIIKALECCSSNNNSNCKECPYDDMGCEFERDALALINRQKAKIADLRYIINGAEETNTHLSNQYIALRKESRHLKEELDTLKRDTIPKLQNALERANYYGLKADEEIEYLKAEIKRLNERTAPISKVDRLTEFAERVKIYAKSCKASGYDGIGENDIDEILIEMKGEENE